MPCRLLLFIALFTSVMACEAESPETAEAPPHRFTDIAPGDPKVVVFMIDGPRYSEMFGDPTHQHVPRIWSQLKPSGTLYSNFRNNGWTLTVSGHASILTGTWQMLDNEGLERPGMPTLFEYYRAHTGAPTTDAVIIGGKTKLSALTYSAHPSYGSMYGAASTVGAMSDGDVYGQLLSALQNDQPHLVVVSFSEVDLKGHSGVWDDYVAQIEVVDSLAVETWNYLQSDPYYMDQTYMFITADHGRHNDQNGGFKSHGDSCEGCQHLVFLALGPDVRQDYTVPSQLVYSQPDICATAAEILSIPAPYSVGNPMLEMFEPVATGIR